MNEIDHLSNSQLNGLLSCQWRYYLERVLGLRRADVPAWYFIGGNTVHAVTEKWERAAYL